MKKVIFKLLCAMGAFAMNASVSYAQDQTTFIITTENNDNDDTHVNNYE